MDAVFDEGIGSWFPHSLGAGFQPLTPDEPAMSRLEALGWRRAVIPAGRYPGLAAAHACIDFSGWPLYTRASLPDDVAYDVCGALSARKDWIPWDERSYKGIDQIGRDTEETPLDVPLHPGAERWYREHAGG